MAKIILGLSGEIASGKGTIAKHVIEKYNGNSHRFSTSLRDVLKRLYIDDSRENMQNLSSILRGQFGQDILAKIIFNDTKEDSKDVVVVDGVRRADDIIHLREMNNFKLIYIETDLEKRYERITKRGENADDNTKTFEEFKKDQEGEAEQQIKGLKEIADFVIDNNGTLEELYAKVDEIISNLQK